MTVQIRPISPSPCTHEDEYFSWEMYGIACANCGQFLREADPDHVARNTHQAPGPIERRLVHQPRHTWSPKDLCPHVASVAVKGFQRGDYRQCLSCGAEVAA